MIELRNVSKSYDRGSIRALDGVSLLVETGETMVLLGSSGSGKTTALKLVNRLVEPSDGDVVVDGRRVRDVDIYELRRSIGYAFQGIGLFPHLTVRQNIGVVPMLLGWSEERIRTRTAELLDMMRLSHAGFADRYPDALSGGQAQRVGVARALAADPDHLLMDEPFGALDVVTRRALQDEMLDTVSALGKTIVFVTHDLFEALRLGDRIAVLHRGRLHQCGTGDELSASPATPFVADLFRRLEEQLADVEHVRGAAH